MQPKLRAFKAFCRFKESISTKTLEQLPAASDLLVFPCRSSSLMVCFGTIITCHNVRESEEPACLKTFGSSVINAVGDITFVFFCP